MLGLLAGSAGVAVEGCNPACTFRQTVNAPENLSMRRSMLKTAMGDVCTQLKNRNAPLRLTADSPVIGRFYPNQCTATDGDVLNISFAGYGYAWTNLSKKATFTGVASAGFRYDFQVTESGACDIYAYFRPSRIDTATFTTHRLESALATAFNGASLGDSFGKQTLSQKLQEGFTVIAKDADQKNPELALGIVPVGQKPFHPYQVTSTDGKITYENDRTEVHQNERDFVGPIVVSEEKRSLFVSANLDGAPAVDVIVMRKADAEASLQAYFEIPQAGPMTGMPLASDVLKTGSPMHRAIVVPPGTYYVIFDNTSSAGQTAPVINALDDRAAVINYLIQIGDAS